MAKVAIGSIPEKISYVFSDEKEVPVGCAWDISWYDSEDEPKTVKKKVLPSFPVDSSDAKSLDKAIAWASNPCWNLESKTYISKAHYIEEVENKSIKNIAVLSLEERGNGGRAYKALIDKYYVDLREDVLMDTLLQVGIEPGGILKGEYIWAKMGSQMKLVRIGSELHRLIVEFESKKDLKPVGKGNLEIGGIYQDRKKNKAIFIGYVNTTTYKSTDTTPIYARKPQSSKFDFKKTTIKKALLFYEIPHYEAPDKMISSMKLDKDYFYRIKKTHTYIEKVGQTIIPDDIIKYLRDKSQREIKEKILEFTGHNPPKTNYAKITGAYLEQRIEYNSDYLNLYEYGSKAPELFDVKKFLLFS